MKQIITNRKLPVLLKGIFIKIFGDLLAMIPIFEVAVQIFQQKIKKIEILIDFN